ncbi:hypothetical protein [Chelativorans sp. M5D2P16]|uniref:hypothetical protein n=1 Tax=Chelativorans sp. M5D2P16 TaxID=3095678 RepID=UPI002ACA9910|nr:hypothetical protein [Chelativorans sp. M5D2P16]MDZ5697609.1 hypothetical protein [Chelativorans sp. M5D2P16]
MEVFAHQIFQRLRVRRETGPIETVEALCHFAHTRAAFVAQKKLYGYLKARIGTRYPSMFEDDVFVESINIAKRHVFAACLSDIAVHAGAHVMRNGRLEGADARRIAQECFAAGLAANREDFQDEAMLASWGIDFSNRLDGIRWENLAVGNDCFTESPKALYRWAPIEESLKRYDREIVENSIRFAWAEVIRDLRKRAVAEAISADLRQRD